MSRCFPFPPPGYLRNPVAVAEAETTAKLQREREKAEKKKEKRSNRKALQQDDEMSKHSKRSHKKRKHEAISTIGDESKTISKESAEQLEKSGISEEHGPPCSVQTVLHSPESSQDSSKRRKVVLPSPSQAKNGNILRIKIKRDPDSPRGVLSEPIVLDQPTVKQMGQCSSQLSKPNSTHQLHKVNMESAAATERINVEPRATQKQASTLLPSKFTSKGDPQMAKVVQQIDSKLSVKPPVGRSDLQPARVIPPSKMAQRDLPGGTVPAKMLQRVDSQVPPVGRSDLQPPRVLPPLKMAQRDLPGSTVPAKVQPRVDRQVPPVGRSDLQPGRVPSKMAQRDVPSSTVPAKVLQRVVPQVPSEIQRKYPPACPKALPSAIRQLENQQPLPVQNSKLEAPVVDQIKRPMTPVWKEEPSSSGRNADAVRGQEAKPSKSDRRKSHKAEKKEKKFRDLFVTWNPPSFETENSVVGVQDWLFGSTRNSDVCMTNCRASDGSVPFQSMEQQHSLQPRASYLPDVELYQLPYVVPF